MKAPERLLKRQDVRQNGGDHILTRLQTVALCLALPIVGFATHSLVGTIVMLLWQGAEPEDFATVAVTVAAGTVTLIPVAWRMAGIVMQIVPGVVEAQRSRVRMAVASYIVVMPLLYYSSTSAGLSVSSALGLLGAAGLVLPAATVYLLAALAFGYWLYARSA